MFWEDTDSGKPFIGTASVLVTRKRYVREVKPYSCLATRRVRAPSAVYFPTTGNHMLFWQEQGRGTWVIGGELLQGQSKVLSGRARGGESKTTCNFTSYIEKRSTYYGKNNVVCYTITPVKKARRLVNSDLHWFHENNNNSISIKWLPRDTRKNDETYYACVTNNARWR